MRRVWKICVRRWIRRRSLSRSICWIIRFILIWWLRRRRFRIIIRMFLWSMLSRRIWYLRMFLKRMLWPRRRRRRCSTTRWCILMIRSHRGCLSILWLPRLFSKFTEIRFLPSKIRSQLKKNPRKKYQLCRPRAALLLQPLVKTLLRPKLKNKLKPYRKNRKSQKNKRHPRPKKNSQSKLDQR